MEFWEWRLKIIIDIHKKDDIDSKTSLLLYEKIEDIFDAKTVNFNDPREVFMADDITGRQIKVDSHTYVIMLVSYKSLLSSTLVNPGIWSRYWYGAIPTTSFSPDKSKVQELKDIADFHYKRSKDRSYPYLIVMNVENLSNKEDIFDFIYHSGYPSNKIIIMDSSESFHKNLQVMVKLIEMNLKRPQT